MFNTKYFSKQLISILVIYTFKIDFKNKLLILKISFQTILNVKINFQIQVSKQLN